MSLEEFEMRGAPLEVRVSWLPDTLWFVPDERHAETLVRDGISRGRIWSAKELSQLMSIGDQTQEQVQKIAHTKMATDGEITGVRLRLAEDEL